MSSASRYPDVSGSNPVVSTTTYAKAQLIRYKKVVCWGLSPTTVNFAQAGAMGHRVCISIPVDVMNSIFVWSRATGELQPTGRLNNVHASGSSPLTDALVLALGSGFNDLDGVAAGLNFSTTALDMAGDLKRDPSVYNAATQTATGISSTHYGANDLVMAYLMFKCFGSSAYDPTDVIYNVDDAFNMLSSQQLADAITASLEAEDALAAACTMPAKQVSAQAASDNKGQVDAMFRAFLAADPLRYFKNGIQIPGLFETNFVLPADASGADPAGNGNWCLTVGDKLELPIQLVFRAPVNVLSVQDNVQNPSSSTPDSANTNVIKGEASNFNCATEKADKANAISIRLQIVCSAPAGANTAATAAPSLPLQVAATAPVTLYKAANYGIQKALAVVAAGGTGALHYAFSPAVTVAGLSISATTGLLTFNATAAGVSTIPSGLMTVTVAITDSATPTAASVNASVKITFDDGAGSSSNVPTTSA